MWHQVHPDCPRHDHKILIKQIFTNTDGGLRLVGYCPACKHQSNDGWYAYEYRQQELVEIALSGDVQAKILVQYEAQMNEGV